MVVLSRAAGERTPWGLVLADDNVVLQECAEDSIAAKCEPLRSCIGMVLTAIGVVPIRGSSTKAMNVLRYLAGEGRSAELHFRADPRRLEVDKQSYTFAIPSIVDSPE